MENFELSDCVYDDASGIISDVSLRDTCYEHIKDTFYYGLFGDFKLVIDKATGSFNATKLCAEGGKEYRRWKILEKSKKMVEYYQENRGKNSSPKNRGPDLALYYEVEGANKDKIERQITGTYVPKELILDIASWISIEFYDKCNKVIINYFVNEFKKMDKTKLENKIKEVEEQMTQLTLEYDGKTVENNELKEMITRLEESNKRQEEYIRSFGISLEEVKDQNDGLHKQVKKVQRKLGIAVEDRAPLPEDESKRERFVLLKRNDDEYYPYYTIRAQNDYTKRKLKSRSSFGL